MSSILLLPFGFGVDSAAAANRRPLVLHTPVCEVCCAVLSSRPAARCSIASEPAFKAYR